jgi:protein PhnA
METKDCYGNLLSEKDSIFLVKDLKLKGSSKTYKQGTVFKNIRLTDSPEEVEVREGKTTIVLRTEFIKKK